MRLVHRPETDVMGLQVVAGFDRLHVVVPELWDAMFARRDELPAPPDGRYAEASVQLGGGRYRETVGVALVHPPKTRSVAVPRGMSVARLATGLFVTHRHEGDVGDIASGFQAIYDWAEGQDLELGTLKLDIGYTTDCTAQAHDLFINVLG
ncbi:hypothetical protein [Georgenia sp. SYP-B2076]|uniref:hypothetical protein n=1 Tax=Georgenia sp. SYP-B2076 TaxID=2495881 RepID=UPI000F8E03C7|nr:hypothetical protein [Georgenia sp. SYP-B2076]